MKYSPSHPNINLSLLWAHTSPSRYKSDEYSVMGSTTATRQRGESSENSSWDKSTSLNSSSQEDTSTQPRSPLFRAPAIPTVIMLSSKDASPQTILEISKLRQAPNASKLTIKERICKLRVWYTDVCIINRRDQRQDCTF